MHQNIETKFNNLKERNLSIDITRGKPDRSQLDLSNELIDISIDPFFKVIKNKTFNPVRGVFRPIQLDTSNKLEFKYVIIS